MNRIPRNLIATSATLVAGLVLASLAAVAVAAAPNVASSVASGASAENYVAFGDSFVSGPGILPQRAGGCERSEKNFPSVVAQTLHVASFEDASCAGATTAHFASEQVRSGGTNPAQLDALSADTTLVTFGTMGGNDIGLVQLAQGCASTACVPAAGIDPLASKFAQVRIDLAEALAETKRRAPQADVMVIGYGTYMPPGGCPPVFMNLIDAAEFDYVQDQIDRLSDLLRDVAAEAGARFVDQREIPGTIEHTACADEATAGQWIRGLNTYNDGALFHPSTAGMAATAAYVVSEVEVMRDKGEHVAPPVVKPTPPVVKPAPTKAQRLAVLKRKAASAKLTATCQGSRRAGSATLRVRGGSGTVKAVTFRAGAKKVSVDRKSPFAAKKKSATLRKALKKRSSKVRATVTFREHGVSTKRTLTLKKRPACLR